MCMLHNRTGMYYAALTLTTGSFVLTVQSQSQFIGTNDTQQHTRVFRVATRHTHTHTHTQQVGKKWNTDMQNESKIMHSQGTRWKWAYCEDETDCWPGIKYVGFACDT